MALGDDPSEEKLRASRFVPASPAYKVSKKKNPRESQVPRMVWKERIKTDFAFSKPEYRVKTRWQAYRGILSFFKPVADEVNPNFIQDFDHLFTRSLESLVIAIRRLTSKNQKNALQNLRRIPLYNDIIRILQEWDIEGVNRELSQLQRDPRGRTFVDLENLSKYLLKPFFRLSALNVHLHIGPAITKIYEFNLLYNPNQQERDKITRCYSIAREVLPEVFSKLRIRMYPILLKLLSEHYFDIDNFYLEKNQDILSWLDLKTADLLHDRGGDSSGQTQDEDEEKKEEKPAEPEAADKPPSKLALHGFEMLDSLFPSAGWANLDNAPDFYSYYQTIFAYPKGTDLIPSQDPMQVVQALSEIIQNLFHGFQNFQWGVMRDQFGVPLQIESKVENIVTRWHFFMEEILTKQYLPQLQDYCREVERSGVVSEEARRKEQNLLWLKQSYLLPYLKVPIFDEVRFLNLGYPSLEAQVKELINLLAPIAVSVEQGVKSGAALENPDAKAVFPMTSAVSIRFQHFMKRSVPGKDQPVRILDLATNRGLLYVMLTLLSTLEYLVANRGSSLYKRKQDHLYRTSGRSDDDKPIYAVTLRNTPQFLKRINTKPPLPLKDNDWRTLLADLYGHFIAEEDLRKKVAAFHSNQVAFSVMSFTVLRGSREKFLTILSSYSKPDQTISRQEDGSVIVTITGEGSTVAVELAKIVAQVCAKQEPAVSIAALILPFQRNWSMEKLQEQIAKGLKDAENIPPQILGVYSPYSQNFDFRDDLPVPAQDEEF